MENLILTTKSKNLVEVDYLQQDNNTISCQSCIVKSNTTEDVIQPTNAISNNPLIQYDNLSKESSSVTNLKSSIFGVTPIEDFTSNGSTSVNNNCVINEEQETQCINGYTKEEITDILSNYYTKEQIDEVLNNIDLTTGEEYTFYINGLVIKKEIPTSDIQISFTISNGISTEKIFNLKLDVDFILHANSLFTLWFYLNGLSLSTTYVIKSTLNTASGKKISEGSFVLKPSRMYEMFTIPMNTNFLNKSVKILEGEVIYLTVNISKDTTFSETISITSGETNPSKLLINSNQSTSNNIFDYIEGIKYSQSMLNNSIIWENF